jgi:hypothetical protein
MSDLDPTTPPTFQPRARVARAARRWRLAALILAGVLILVVGWAAGTDRKPRGAVAVAQTASTADEHASMEAELERVRAKLAACQDLGRPLRSVALRQEAQWWRHRGAHKRAFGPGHVAHAFGGRIGQEEMRRIWNETIAAGDALTPLLKLSAKQWLAECGP